MYTSAMVAKLRSLGSNTRVQLINHQDRQFFREVAKRLEDQAERIAIMAEPQTATEAQLTFPLVEEAHLMTLEEIRNTPDHSVIWAESRIVYTEKEVEVIGGINPGDVDIDLAPMEKLGRKLIGAGLNTEIDEDMFTSGNWHWKIRYWNARPEDTQRSLTAWPSEE